ncbi:MAG: DUF115 domain-containing protein [Sulfurimonas sp.]|nr:DUF115 domain-containing protein [Sulfurimonas sp.]MDQ7059866.1 DUF115 domain-containing protein [Sulfurimonas sp.]
MKDINATITQNFEDNIKYFEKEHPQLFGKLSALDNAIEKKFYQEKYELVYENDGFDVLEKESGVYLYAKESLAHSIITTESVNFKKDVNTFEGFIRHPESSIKLQEMEHIEPSQEHLKSILPITAFIQENEKEDKLLQSIDKFIFFGSGLGMHIEKIHEKIAAKIYFIIEDDLELFKLSLLTINYKNIAKEATLLFSVFEGKEEFMNSCAVFLDLHYEYNHYLKFFHLLSHKEKKLDDFGFYLASQPHIRFLFNNLTLQYTQPFNYIFDDYKFLNKSLNLNNSPFKKFPFLLLASGPSLEENITWLKNNEKNFLTIAVSSSLAYLESQNIIPNIIIHIDPFEWGIVSFEKLDSIDFIKSSLCFFSSTTPSNIMSLIDKKNLYLFETGTNYKEDSFKPSSPCVGSLAYQLLLIMNVQNIYLLGLDLAVDEKSGKTHAGTHQSLKELKKNKNLSTNSFSYKESLLDIAGNKSKIVQTTPGFYSSVYVIEQFTTQLKKSSQLVYNLSSGAKFTDTITFNTQDMHLKEKQIQNSKLEKFKKYLLSNSIAKLSSNELSQLKLKHQHALSLQNTLIKINIKSFPSIETYIDFIYTKIIPKQDVLTYQLSQILDTYLHYILSYIYDFFNLQESYETKNLHTLIKLLNQELSLISEVYLDSFSNKLIHEV